MKILAGCFQCEANSFSGDRAGIEDFEVYWGEEALRKMAATSVFIAAGAETVPLVYACALPSGMVKRQAFDYFCKIILEKIKNNPDAKGIYLYLHGSMMVEELGNGEEALLLAIRETVGWNIPISLACDFHANLSLPAVRCVNAVFGFRTAPHTDQDETEQRAAKALLKCIRAGALPRPEIVRIPILAGDGAVTEKEPFRSITAELARLDGEEDVVSCALMNGQPWFDAGYTGGAAIVSRLNGQEKTRADALRLAKMFWDGRKETRITDAVSTDDAVELSLKNIGKVLFVNDSGDNTTAGAAGTGTLLLKKYLEAGAEGVLICGVFDRENTCMLLNEQIGTEKEIVLNCGKQEKQEVETRLSICLKKKGKVFGWAGDEVGEGVLLSSCGVDILLTNARAAFTTPAHFARMGVDPAEYNAVVLKMGYLFPELRQISNKIIFVLTPGTSSNDFTQLAYKNLFGKRYPKDADIEWTDIVNGIQEV